MKYHIGDRFLLDTLEVEVLFINKGLAWLGPVEDEPELFKGCVYFKVDEKGYTPEGKRIRGMVTLGSSAV